MIVDYKLPSGYGDAITIITYYTRLAYMADTAIDVNFHIGNPNKKYDSTNADTLTERVDALIGMFSLPETLINFNTVTGNNQRASEDFEEVFRHMRGTRAHHTIWETRLPPIDHDHVVLWRPDKIPARKAKRTILNPAEWDWVEAALETQSHVVKIDYDTPINQVIEYIRTAKACVGYDGIGQFISKQFWKPLVTIGPDKESSKKHGGDWSSVCNYTPVGLIDYDSEIKRQQPLIDQAHERWFDGIQRKVMY